MVDNRGMYYAIILHNNECNKRDTRKLRKLLTYYYYTWYYECVERERSLKTKRTANRERPRQAARREVMNLG